MKRVTLTLCLLLVWLSAFAGKKKSPNILFILVDDMQKDCINAYGCEDVMSPNIDRIIKEGVSVSNAYTNGSLGGALSMASRAMLLTGRGLYDIIADGSRVPEEHITMPQLFGQAGYSTFATGKWHQDKASFNRSFDNGENIFFGGMHSYNNKGHFSPRLYHYDPTGAYAEPFTGEQFSSEMYTDAAIGFLNGRKKNDDPYFLYVAYTSPHDPRNRHPEYGKKYDPAQVEIPVNYLPIHPFDNGEQYIRDEVYIPTPRTEEGIRGELADYYGMINEVDFQIGRLLETLERSGEADNTIIVFASDNGLAMGRHGLLGKQNLYEHSSGVPLVFIAPGLEKGVTRKAYCYLHDIYPTLCEMTGVEPAASVKGKSLVPTLEGTGRHRDRIFLSYNSLQRALVMDDWKYIIYNVRGVINEQLFDLTTDPNEMVNLAGDPAYAFKTSAYKRILNEELKKHNDFCDLDTFMWWDKGGYMETKDQFEMYVEP